MPRPIETLLSLPRVRLFAKVPILETEELVRRFLSRTEYQPRLVKDAYGVSKGSAEQFSSDDQSLSALLEEAESGDYVVTRRSREVLENLLGGIYQDGAIYKDFEQEIQPLCEISRPLREITKIADNLADRTKEESIDVARALMISFEKAGSRGN